MPQLTALSLSIAVLGAIWAYLALGPLAGFVLVWAGFIAWGCFFHCGGDQKALIKTIAGTAYGAVVAWIALLIITHLPANSMGALLPAIVVGVTVFFLVIVASVEQLSAVYGLGGRVRRAGSPAERARTAVTARLRASIERISAVHPELGRHLRASVRTGTVCVYEPESPRQWGR